MRFLKRDMVVKLQHKDNIFIKLLAKLCGLSISLARCGLRHFLLKVILKTVLKAAY